jgi:hypothetical protein
MVEHRNNFQEAGVVCENGLADGEIQLVEDSFGFQFPPDLRPVASTLKPTHSGPLVGE